MMIVTFLLRRSCLTLFKYCGLPICVDFTTAQLESNLYNIRFFHKMSRWRCWDQMAVVLVFRAAHCVEGGSYRCRQEPSSRAATTRSKGGLMENSFLTVKWFGLDEFRINLLLSPSITDETIPWPTCALHLWGGTKHLNRDYSGTWAFFVSHPIVGKVAQIMPERGHCRLKIILGSHS